MARDENERRHRPSLRRQGALALALVAGWASTFAAAPPMSSTFGVKVTLVAAEPPAAQCGSVVDPTTNKITVTCQAPAAPRDVSRYLLHVYRAGEWLPVDGQMATGTLTSWRIVHVANREYLEMMVGW